MVTELVFKNGEIEIVERCFMLESKRKGKWRTRFIAQRRAGSPLRWFRPRDLEHVNYERPDLLPSGPEKGNVG